MCAASRSCSWQATDSAVLPVGVPSQDAISETRRPVVSEDDLIAQMRELRAIVEGNTRLLQKLQDDLQALREEVAQLRPRQPPTDAIGRTLIR